MKPAYAFHVVGCLLLVGCYSNPLYKGYAAKPLGLDTRYPNLVRELTTAPAGQRALIDSACFSLSSLDPERTTRPDLQSKCLQQRNEAIAALVISSEDACLMHRRSMYGNEAVTNITFGTLTNLFSGAAAAITNEKYRPVYAALALFSNSERSLINETIYKQILVTSVDKKIVEMRESRMQAIAQEWKKPLAEYGMNEAIQDVVRLHATCSFMDGLHKALEEGTQDQTGQRILRLRASLQVLDAEYGRLQDKGTPAANGLRTRIENINKVLMKEEVK